jgi:hemoglobin-like flavoprotein
MRGAVARRLRHPTQIVWRFFRVIASTLREILGTEWSPEIEQAWQNLLGELGRLISQAESWLAP